MRAFPILSILVGRASRGLLRWLFRGLRYRRVNDRGRFCCRDHNKLLGRIYRSSSFPGSICGSGRRALLLWLPWPGGRHSIYRPGRRGLRGIGWVSGNRFWKRRRRGCGPCRLSSWRDGRCSTWGPGKACRSLGRSSAGWWSHSPCTVFAAWFALWACFRWIWVSRGLRIRNRGLERLLGAFCGGRWAGGRFRIGARGGWFRLFRWGWTGCTRRFVSIHFRSSEARFAIRDSGPEPRRSCSAGGDRVSAGGRRRCR